MLYYGHRTINDAQLNYTTTEKGFLVVFTLEKFRQYLLGFRTIVFTGHSVLRYLMTKKDVEQDSFNESFFCKNLTLKYEIRKAWRM